ncbi:MAG TPA: DUF1015 family protein [Longimicrobiales bacterium]|jgi:uncharacterized protein (DUF1015 family)
MITLSPISRALVPVDSAAAARVSAPNYDEFQSDIEVWELLRERPDSVLSVTMAHCDAALPREMLEADSEASLERARQNMLALRGSALVRVIDDALFVYEITGPRNPGIRQIGLGGMARTDQIRTEASPRGPIIRNEGVREAKARGRARLIEVTEAFIGTVNNAVPDADGSVAAALEAFADARPADLEVSDAHGNRHRVWLVQDPQDAEALQAKLGAEPEAYVADGNHRSAAAAMLGREHFLAVFFTAGRMGIAPYNRLVRDIAVSADELLGALAVAFDVRRVGDPAKAQPSVPGTVGLYDREHGWLHLTPRPHTFDPTDAVQVIDHDIVHRNLFAGVLGIADAEDERLAFVGANRDVAWLREEVDAGRATYAVTLAAVPMARFMAVCHQGGFMPPKSTWFEPKIRSGLVMALL